MTKIAESAMHILLNCFRIFFEHKQSLRDVESICIARKELYIGLAQSYLGKVEDRDKL